MFNVESFLQDILEKDVRSFEDSLTNTTQKLPEGSLSLSDILGESEVDRLARVSKERDELRYKQEQQEQEQKNIERDLNAAKQGPAESTGFPAPNL